MQEIILVHVTGSDRPGLTASLTEVLAGYGVHILDIGQVTTAMGRAQSCR